MTKCTALIPWFHTVYKFLSTCKIFKTKWIDSTPNTIKTKNMHLNNKIYFMSSLFKAKWCVIPRIPMQLSAFSITLTSSSIETPRYASVDTVKTGVYMDFNSFNQFRISVSYKYFSKWTCKVHMNSQSYL